LPIVAGLTNGTPAATQLTRIITSGYIGGAASVFPIITSSLNLFEDWFIEESRIRGGYNNTSVDLGVKAYLVEEEPQQQIFGNKLIYSGILNSRTGVNNTNQFPIGEEISRSVDPISGTIQKLYAENTNLIILQERKVNNRVLYKNYMQKILT